MQLSGGQLLTPVRKLVSTLICESPRVHQKEHHLLGGVLFLI